MTVNLTWCPLHTDLNAVIQLGMNLVLTVLILKPIIAGIVLVVIVLVMMILYVAMDLAVMVDETGMKHGPDDCNAPGECDDGLYNRLCDDDCCPESWIGDGFEDCEDQAIWL